MPVVDMSLEELKTYGGRNPRPADFDGYWERALAELSALPLDYELVEDGFSAPGVQCFHLYFTGVGGARIHSRFLRPETTDGKIPALLYFHGYRGHCGDWYGKLPYAMGGMCVAAMDARGQSGESEDNLTVKGSTFYGHIIRGVEETDPDRLLFRSVFLDTVQLARILMTMDFVDPENIGAAGFSQGGALAVACAALEPRIKLLAAGYPFLCDYLRVWEMDLAKDAYEEIRTWFRLRDPMHRRESAFWLKLGYIDLQHMAHRIRARTVFFTGLMDTVCPPSTQFAAYNRITAEKRMVLYPDFGHETLPEADEQVYQLMRDGLRP